MRVNGIIAEYNPFHNGHSYQLQESRRLTGAEHTVVVMSGDFVQRGAPALVDKQARAEMALRCGADLVLELPVLYACSSAEAFAAGGVALLDGLGAVTHLCFGSECGDVDALGRIAAFLLDEPEQYRAALKDFLKQGLSYPDARGRALGAWGSGCFGGLDGSDGSALPDNCGEIVASPNNILGIDYIKALLRFRSDMVPVTVQRIGAGYHEEAPLTDGPDGSDSLADSLCPDSSAHMAGSPCPAPSSALAIRKALLEGCPLSRVAGSMPEAAAGILASCLENGRLLGCDDFSSLLYYKLLTEQGQGYEKYLDVSSGLSDRIRKQLNGFTGYEAFCDLLKTKDMTYTRISRCLLHILLGLEKSHMELGLGYAPYARVLGLRRQAAPLLGAIKRQSRIPLITKLADAKKSLSADAYRLLELDIRSSAIYQAVAHAHTGRPATNEFSRPLVIL